MTSRSRRSFLGTLTTAAVAALAGCGGGNDDEAESSGDTTGALAAARAPEGDFVLGGLANEGPWLARLDADGNVAWQRRPDVREAFVGSVVADGRGITLAGQQTAKLNTPAPGAEESSERPTEGQVGWVQRRDRGGARVWDRTFKVERGMNTVVRTLYRLPNGEFLVGGLAEDPQSVPLPTPSEDHTAFLTRFGPDGERERTDRPEARAVQAIADAGGDGLQFPEEETATPAETDVETGTATSGSTDTDTGTATGQPTGYETRNSEFVLGGSVSSAYDPESFFSGGNGWLGEYDEGTVAESAVLDAGAVTAMAPRHDGGVVVTGLKRKVGERQVGNDGDTVPKLATVTAAISAAGEVVWDAAVRFQPGDSFVAVVSDDDGYLVLGDTTPGENAGRYAVGVAYDHEGNERWRRAYNDGEQGMVVFDAVPTENGAALAGSTGGESGATVAALQQVRPDGSPGWQRTVDGTASD